MNFKIGDIILSHQIDSDAHKWISLLTGSYWSHASLYLGNDVMIEATRDGVHLSSLSGELNKCDFKVLRCNVLSTKQKEELITISQRYINYDYDFGSMIFKWKHNFSPKAKYGKKPKQQINCCKLIVDCYENVGISLSPSIDFPIPKDLLLSPFLCPVC